MHGEVLGVVYQQRAAMLQQQITNIYQNLFYIFM